MWIDVGDGHVGSHDESDGSENDESRILQGHLDEGPSFPLIPEGRLIDEGRKSDSESSQAEGSD